MDDMDKIIDELREEIRSREEILHKAATYHKQLIEEGTQLNTARENLVSEIEVLANEKRSYQCDLEAVEKSINSQSDPLELHGSYKEFQMSEKHYDQLLKDFENLKQENQHLLKTREDFNLENKLLKEELRKRKKHLENLQEKSVCEAKKDTTQELQAQLNTYKLSQKELQDELSDVQCEVEKTNEDANNLLTRTEELKEILSNKNSELSTYKAELKVAKENLEELRAEIESRKLDEVDVKRRGNSVFAELDDRKDLVERSYKELLKKYEDICKASCECRKELDKKKEEVILLQSIGSQSYHEIYINNLEDSLAEARMEINDLTMKLAKTYRKKKTLEDEVDLKRDGFDYWKTMLEQSQKEEKELSSELVGEKEKIMSDNYKLGVAEYHVNKAEEDLSSARKDIFSLRQKIKDLEQGIKNVPIELAEEKKTESEQVRNHVEVSRKNDNCAQQ